MLGMGPPVVKKKKIFRGEGEILFGPFSGGKEKNSMVTFGGGELRPDHA